MKQNGLTLIEVITVSAIVLVLTTSATLLFSGYVENSRIQTVENMTTIAAASANAFLRKTGKAPTVSDLNLFNSNPQRFIVLVDSPDVIITDVHYSISDTVNFE